MKDQPRDASPVTVIPLDTVAVQASLADAIVGHRIEYHRLVGSTMDVTRDLAREGAAEGTVVIAEEQNKGRGRFDRTWVSPPGLNLYFTVLLRPNPAQLPYMNMAAALGVYEADGGDHRTTTHRQVAQRRENRRAKALGHPGRNGV